MGKYYGRRRTRRGRTRGSVGNEIASHTWRVTEKAAERLGQWMVTDHTGMSERLSKMPDVGFVDSCKYIVASLAWSVVIAVVQAVCIFVLIAFGIPLLLAWLF